MNEPGEWDIVWREGLAPTWGHSSFRIVYAVLKQSRSPVKPHGKEGCLKQKPNIFYRRWKEPMCQLPGSSEKHFVKEVTLQCGVSEPNPKLHSKPTNCTAEWRVLIHFNEQRKGRGARFAPGLSWRSVLMPCSFWPQTICMCYVLTYNLMPLCHNFNTLRPFPQPSLPQECSPWPVRLPHQIKPRMSFGNNAFPHGACYNCYFPFVPCDSLINSSLHCPTHYPLTTYGYSTEMK